MKKDIIATACIFGFSLIVGFILFMLFTLVGIFYVPPEALKSLMPLLNGVALKAFLGSFLVSFVLFFFIWVMWFQHFKRNP